MYAPPLTHISHVYIYMLSAPRELNPLFTGFLGINCFIEERPLNASSILVCGDDRALGVAH